MNSSDNDTILQVNAQKSIDERAKREELKKLQFFFKFKSNGDGTCKIVKAKKSQLPSVLEVPSVSPSGEAVTEIKSGLFRACEDLTSVTIPDSVKRIGKGIFSCCSSLERITIPFVGNRADVTSSETDQYPLGYIFGSKKFTECTPATQYYYGKNTKSVSKKTYYIPSSLKTVTVTGGNILRGAFSYCSSLTSIMIPNGVTSIGDDAFNGCHSLTSIMIPNGVTSIGNNAFSWCSGLTNIVIPDSVTSIGDYAFSWCSGLTNIVIPDSVKNIEDGAFSWCSGLTSINVSSANADYHSIGNCLIETATNTVVLGCKNSMIPTDGSITRIGDHAFEGCKFLSGINIPDSITSIDMSSFSCCDWLTSIIIPDSVTYIGGSAFFLCDGLMSVTIGNGVTCIDQGAFEGCGNLTSISFNGTKKQWKAIEKCKGWKKDVPTTFVHCSDSNVQI